MLAASERLGVFFDTGAHFRYRKLPSTELLPPSVHENYCKFIEEVDMLSSLYVMFKIII